MATNPIDRLKALAELQERVTQLHAQTAFQTREIAERFPDHPDVYATLQAVEVSYADVLAALSAERSKISVSDSEKLEYATKVEIAAREGKREPDPDPKLAEAAAESETTR